MVRTLSVSSSQLQNQSTTLYGVHRTFSSEKGGLNAVQTSFSELFLYDGGRKGQVTENSGRFQTLQPVSLCSAL